MDGYTSLPGGANKRICGANPMHLILIADDSDSMAGDKSLHVSQGIAEWIVHLQMMTRGIKPWFRFSFVLFGTTATALVQNQDINNIDEKSIFLRGSSGTTNMTHALQLAAEVIAASNPQPEHCRPFVFIYTDGQADDPESAHEAAYKLKKLPLPCGSPHVVTLGIVDADHEFLSRLATSPEFYVPCGDAETLRRLLPSIGTPGKVASATESGLGEQIRQASQQQTERSRNSRFEQNIPKAVQSI